ncbi:MAG TPA: phospholipase D-like domain-containing protein [Polyangia bacterium]|nr:phospholipase D-like domain-containing protein [Polyangia bacterium]
MRHPAIARAPGDLYCLHPEAVVAGHRLAVLIDGAAAYPAMLDAIAAATRTIDLETYIFADDATGRRFADALIERARAGVTVRLVVDAVGSFDLSDPLRRQMVDAGVKLVDFHPVAPWRRRWGWSVRNHRKLLIVDGAVGFTGGLNIGDDYAPRAWSGRAWHDVHVQVEGPAVRDLQKQFLATWRHAADPPHGPALARATPAAIGPARAQVLASAGRRARRKIRRHYYHAMKRAREHIYVQASYFIPDRALRRVLRNAARRGVDVRVMLPHESDIPAVQYAAQATYTRLLRAGVRIYEWVPTMLHAKTLLVDGIWCAIGSYNFDRRSLTYNWELSVAIVDRATCAELGRAFEADQESSCLAIDPVTWARRGLWQRVLERFFYTFRRWL